MCLQNIPTSSDGFRSSIVPQGSSRIWNSTFSTTTAILIVITQLPQHSKGFNLDSCGIDDHLYLGRKTVPVFFHIRILISHIITPAQFAPPQKSMFQHCKIEKFFFMGRISSCSLHLPLSTQTLPYVLNEKLLYHYDDPSHICVFLNSLDKYPVGVYIDLRRRYPPGV